MRDLTVCRVAFKSLCFVAIVGVYNLAYGDTEKCSEKFVGTVIDVSKSEASLSSLNERESEPRDYGLSKEQDVVFKVANSKQGVFTPFRSITVLATNKNYKFEKGQSYRVSLDGDELCRAQYIAVR